MIVRDESAMLPDCLESVGGVVDEIIVVDTGSRDNTPEIAAGFNARVLHHDWDDDFAAARNVSLDAAGGDWILWIDADERLRREEHGRIRQLISGRLWDAFLVPILSPNPYGGHVTRGHRLFRNRPEVRFSGRIHEQVGPVLEACGYRISLADFTIDHLGYNLDEEQQRAKNQRNFRLLCMAKDEHPRDPYVRFTLAQCHMSLGKAAAAEQELKAALGESGSVKMRKALPPDIRASAYANLADWAVKRGAPLEALVRCDESLRVRSQQVMAHLIAYRAHKALGRDEEALRDLQRAEQFVLHPPANGGAAVEVPVNLADVLRGMGYCCLRLSRPAEARAYFQRALKVEEDHPRTIAALSRCAIAECRLDEALSLAERAFGLAPRDDSLLDLIGFVLLRQGRFVEAAERIGQLCLRRPKDNTLKRRLAGVLVRAGRPHDAADLLAELDGLKPVLSA